MRLAGAATITYRRLFLLGSLTLAIGHVKAETPPLESAVQAILAERCRACHGPGARVRLVSSDELLRYGSRVLERVSTADPLRRMPLKSPPLSSSEVDVIRRFVGQRRVHWAYQSVRPPLMPPQQAWGRNGIDRFTLQRLQREGLTPSPEADRATLLRRVSFDLTGLPPSLEELDRFLADRAADAYEKAVRRLLDSPAYGERMASEWMDIARYADTHGYQVDSQRDMWPWRDWLIRAFNRNLPFDQFVIEQLAGDLLPGATREQRVATGFNRNHRINAEDGAIAEEFRMAYVMDRAETAATAFLGTTLGCARCHDHKFDPIAQQDYYRFVAYFNQIDEPGRAGVEGNVRPRLMLPDARQEAELNRLNGELVALAAHLSPAVVQPLLEKWESNAWPPPSSKGLLAHYPLDRDLSGGPARLVRGELTYDSGPAHYSLTVNGVTQVDTGVTLPAAQTGAAWTVAAWVKSSGLRQMTVLGSGEFVLSIEDSIPMPNLQRGARLVVRAGGTEIQTRERITQTDWHHVTVTSDAAGLALIVDGAAVDCLVMKDGPAVSGPGAAVEIGNPKMGVPFQGQIDDLRIYTRALSAAEARRLAEEETARAIQQAAPGDRTPEGRERLRSYYLTRVAAEPLREAHKKYQAVLAERDALLRQVPTVMVMEDMPTLRQTFVLARGDYRMPGAIVTAGPPAALAPGLPPGPANRLGLAKWMVDRGNPLTARVAVNRYWQMFFGTGLVKSSEDFGTQGEAPSHPELLDWLAREFVSGGWDVKRLQALIVQSATYRQTARATLDQRRRDPGNRLLSRGPRHRLTAEMIRDNALAASGLLNPVVGGPSVYPYQTAGLWEELAAGDVYTAQAYPPSRGADLYRRSLYSFWKRTAPAPAMTAFDAPDREQCLTRRLPTNTPMQALVLMNDPQFVEAARALAARLLKVPLASRARLAFRLAVSREPTPEEARILGLVAQRNQTRYSAESNRQLFETGEFRADAGLDPGELFGWTIAASVLLNLDETITKQ